MCSMIHNPSIGNPTHVTDGAIDYTFNENLSQGYYVQTFKDAILFNGANICDQKIYPSYCYIIDGKTSAQKQVVKPVTLYKDVKVAADSLQQTQISDRYAAWNCWCQIESISTIPYYHPDISQSHIEKH